MKAPAASLLGLGVVLLLAGCGDRPAPAEPEAEPILLVEPTLRAGDGLLDSDLLRGVVELQVARNEEGLAEAFRHEDPRVRARAAFAAASWAVPELVEGLLALLSDEALEVRRDAAFALGQQELSDEGLALAAALPLERDPEVRHRIIEALGKQGGEEALARLMDLAMGQHEESARTLALSRFLVRGVDHPYLVEALSQRLMLSEWEGREAAAWGFATAPDLDRWLPSIDGIRYALDLGIEDDPSNAFLLLALAKGEDRQDLDRLLAYLADGAEWRIRANAARALGSTFWLETPGVREALMEATTDPFQHVAIAAATSLSAGFRLPPPVLEFARRLLREDASKWTVQFPLLAAMVREGEADLALVDGWVRKVGADHPLAAARGIGLLAELPGPSSRALLLDQARVGHPRVRAAALGALEDRIYGDQLSGAELQSLMELYEEALGAGEGAAAVVAARALANPAFLEFGSRARLEALYVQRSVQGDGIISAAILQALGRTGDTRVLALLNEALEHPDFGIRRAAAEGIFSLTRREVDPERLALPAVEMPVDWALLRRVGAEPIIEVETDRGTLEIRLAPELAPQSVSAFLTQIMAGDHDGIPFHRVLPNFVIQSGDPETGIGSPGYRLGTEITGIPFQRGALGMASAGRDTEGSQWFVTHSYQPHLDAGYSAIGWVVDGAGTLDHILEGDRILRVRLVSPVTM